MTKSLAKQAFDKIKKPRKRLRRESKSPIRTLTTKADRALQDFYRAKYPEARCESCGRQFELMHHYVEKSQSAGLRYEKLNLIFLCHACHFRHHRTGDSKIMSAVVLCRGIAWLKNLMKLRIDRKGWDLKRPYLEEMLKKYTNE